MIPPSAHPLVSVITIVYNDAPHIAQTIESVLSQTYPHIEYIIIDGGSTDGTQGIIQSYIDTSPPKALHTITKFISEKDKGIYDAMNKGVALANGSWCNFMNSGDRFYSPTSIQEVFAQYPTTPTEISVLYGDTQIVFDTQHSKILTSQNTHHKYHHHFTHQSSFIATKLLKTYPYNTAFKIAGDTDFFTKIYHLGYRFQKVNAIICTFDLNGVSSTLSWQMFAEDCQIGYQYNKLYPLFLASKYVFYVIPRTLLRKLIPAKYKNLARSKWGAKYQ
ncbi:hypothetical protein BKH46_01950 [Helicobacter sp. 12S02634-8]|uniref:glycosyltransferase family 2 protein n=1 Tax=Helicobacter sp. 12S02634-8 TaxID=1476199 RepID=UPI000BA7CCFB|nr:glycosyltransferase family 2 protein [Helicobacter sp. 12S02634-8]PAF48098.1 hypothetical protein BKH46_01950 [Helicobacter sp. 12S02634-8]